METSHSGSPESQGKKHLKSNSLSLNKMSESDNFPSDGKSKHRDSHDFIMNSKTSDNFIKNTRREETGGELSNKRSESYASGRDH